MSSPKVSIILPNFNHAPYLEERLDSIIKQSFKDFELIVIDDASTDESLSILSIYKDHIKHLIVNEHNTGSPFQQWKKGIDLAQGEWIWLAESDDVAQPNFLEELLNINSESGLRYCQSMDIDAKGNPVMDRLEYTAAFEPNIWEKDFDLSGKDFCRRYLKVKNVIPNASAAIFKKDLAKDLFSDELLKMRMCGDWLFWIRILQKTSISFKARHLNNFRNLPSATRMHKGFKKISGRLAEEALIRAELAQITGLNQEKEKELLLKKWFDIHRIGEVFSDNFSAFNKDGLYPNFQSRFLKYKLRSKLFSNRSTLNR